MWWGQRQRVRLIPLSRIGSGVLLGMLIAIPGGADEIRRAAKTGDTLDALTRGNAPAMSRVVLDDGGETGRFASPGDFAFVVPRGICENDNAPIQAYEARESRIAEEIPDE